MRNTFVATLCLCVLLWESGPVRPAFDRAPQQLLMEWQLSYCPGAHVASGVRRPGTLHLKGRLGEGPWQETLHLPDSILAAGVTVEELEAIVPDLHAAATQDAHPWSGY